MVIESLRIEGLWKSFGALQILRDVSLTIEPGEHVALIGPNGAGKTTLLNLITGDLPATAGRIYIFGKEITHKPTHCRAHAGLARSFQMNRVFPNLTVTENLLLAAQGVQASRYQMFCPAKKYSGIIAKVQELLELTNMLEKKDELTCEMSHGGQRKLEIAMGLASEPKILLLDEPSAGLDLGEIADFIKLIKTLAKNTTVLFSAHDMDVVFGLAHRVVVLYGGEFIADGTVSEIQANPKVEEIYLGIEENESDTRVS
jgi:branched-chain amino acid transport system ATP-binding protein